MSNEQHAEQISTAPVNSDFGSPSNFLFSIGTQVGNYYEGKTDLFSMGRDILGNTRDGAFAIFGTAGDRMVARFDLRNTFNAVLLNS